MNPHGYRVKNHFATKKKKKGVNFFFPIQENFPSVPQQHGYHHHSQYRQSSQYNFNAQPPINNNPFSPIQRSNTFCKDVKKYGAC